jgi:hypothetical protein
MDTGGLLAREAGADIGSDRHQSMMDIVPGVAYCLLLRGIVKKGPENERQPRRCAFRLSVH